MKKAAGPARKGKIKTTLADFDKYELIHGVSTDQELGKWLVEQGMAGVYFPKPVLPYLDYAAIGAGYYADHDGAYTPSGYVKRRKTTQTQKEEEKTAFVLTLASPTSTYRLGLPTSDDDLEQTKRALRLDDLDSATIRDVEIDYLSSYRRTVFGCTPIIAATSAVLYVVKMFTPHSTYCIASLKSGGKVEGFIIACSYNICNDAGFLLLASKASV